MPFFFIFLDNPLNLINAVTYAWVRSHLTEHANVTSDPIFIPFLVISKNDSPSWEVVVHTFNPSSLETEAGGGQQGLQSKFQDRLGYTEKPCLKNKTNKTEQNDSPSPNSYHLAITPQQGMGLREHLSMKFST